MGEGFGTLGLDDLNQLLAPISDDAPSGVNLEYDPAFARLERAAEGRAEQRMGDSIVPAEPPDWASVAEQALSLLRQTHDLRVAALLARAWLHCAGWPGFADGLSLVCRLLSDYWETAHPELDREDGDDPTMRITALSALGSPLVVHELRAAPLLQSRVLGSLSLKDLLAGGGESTGVDAATVEGILREVDLELLARVAAAARQGRDSIAVIDTVFEERTGNRGPELAALAQTCRDATRVLEARLAERRGAAGDSDPAAADDGAGAGTGATAAGASGGSARGPALSGEIRSRADVVRAIDKICAYYAQAEPTSPLPLLLDRCRRLVDASFLEIIGDLVPDSLSQVEGLGGRKPE